MSQPVLSIILCSRNDGYMGDHRWRLETTLEHVARSVAELGREDDVEVLVADWGSEVPLADALRLGPAARAIVSFVEIPPGLARETQGDSPFPEVLALNAAARRARGEYIGRIDQDTFFGRRFLETFFDLHEGRRGLGAPMGKAIFFSNRRGVPYRFAVRRPPFEHVSRLVRRFGPRLKIEASDPSVPFWFTYVGILLLHRDLWQACGGFDERMIYMNKMENNMIIRLKTLYPVVDLGELTGYDFYHLDHYHPRVLRRTSRRVNDEAFYRPDSLHPNGEAWGLADHELAVRSSTAPAAEPAAAGRADLARFAGRVAAAAAGMAADALLLLPSRISRRAVTSRAVWERRATLAREALRGEPPVRWPGRLKELWAERGKVYSPYLG